MGTTSVITPSTARAWLIRAGFIKAEPGELDWLRAELLGAPDKAMRRRWSAAFTVAGAGLVALAALVVELTSTRESLVPLLGVWIAMGAVFTAWAPTDMFRRRRGATLRRHGLRTDGTVDPSPTRSGRLTAARWLAETTGIVVGLLLLLAFLSV